VSGGVLVPPHEFVGTGMGDEEDGHDPRLDGAGAPTEEKPDSNEDPS